MLFNYFLRNPLLAVAFHILLGVMAQYIPAIEAVYFLGITILGVSEIWQSKHQTLSKVVYYLFYIVGFEIVYRVGKFYFLWELGKYLCILIALTGLLRQSNRLNSRNPFIWYLILLIPGIFVSIWFGHSDPVYLRKLILQHISGPLALGIIGLYLFNRPIPTQELFRILRIAILPSISLVTLLFLGSKISEIDFISSSNFASSGGFGPNQVSTMLGWGIFILIFSLISNKTLTYSRFFDITLLCLLAFRGLLTFSRGGMIASVTAGGLGLFFAFMYSAHYRKKFGKLTFRLLAGLVLVILMALVVNQITDNFLLYRYQGKSTTEVLTGRVLQQRQLSGRGDLIRMEMDAFENYPFLGIGVGQGTLYRSAKFHEFNPSHTEQSRLLGEHGILGIVILVVIFIYLPISYLFKIRFGLNKHWSAQFYLLAFLTMFHSGMRLAMPALAFGLIFLVLIPEDMSSANPHKKNRIKNISEPV